MESNNKDKRISYLSLYSSLCTLYQGQGAKEMATLLASLADKINDQLYEKFPIEDGESKTEPTDTKCPKCKGGMIIRNGKTNGNPWRGEFCLNECGAKPIWLPVGVPQVDEKAYNKK